uniref:COP9 signalosome complex subunit 3 n=1 Tax=Mesocestoides corti TaxID=53468 RepID=A0A5K3EGK6_MESCO
MAGALENFVSALEKAGDNVTELTKVLERNSDFIAKNIASLSLLLDRFELKRWTCVHAAIMRAKIIAAQSIDSLILMQTRNLFENCNPEHLRAVKPLVRELCEHLTSKLIAQSMPMSGIPIILMAIRKVQDSPAHLTSLHVNLCQLGLSAKCFNPLLPILNTDVLDADADKQSFDSKDGLLYFYYGGMVYATLKKWDRSLHFFSIALMLPSPSCYPIILEAAKKYIIVSLIHNGHLNTSNNSVFRRLKFALDVYKKLADAFAEPDPTVLARVVEENMATFVLDKNYGLVKQLFDYHIKSRIQNLTKTFMSLSLKDLAARVHLSGPKEAERHLLEMIASKSIFVKIDQRNGTIRFLDNPEQYDSPEMLKLLSDKMNAAMNLQKNLLQISDHSVVEDATEIKKQPRNVSNLHAPASKRKTPSE